MQRNNKTMIIRNIPFAAAACTLLFAACSSHGTTVEMNDMAEYRWSEAAHFSVDNDDTLSLRDLSVVLRYNRELKADSITVAITTLTPDSLRLEERFTLHVPRTNEVRTVERIFPYRRNARLMKPGVYRFTISPDDEITGVESVGLITGNAQ